MADGQDQTELPMAGQMDGLGGLSFGWHPDGIMAGIPALNAAAAQSTLGAVMTPEQIADVDWGADGPPNLGPMDHTLLKRWGEPDARPVPLDSTSGPDAGSDAPPWTVGEQTPGLLPPGSAPAGAVTADQVDPSSHLVVGWGNGSAPMRNLLERISIGEGTTDADAQAHGYPSGSGYDVIYGYGPTPTPLSQMTLDEVGQLQDQMGAHTPVGKYQITQDTLQGLKDKLGLDSSEPFSPGMQDMMGRELLQRRGWNDYVSGNIDASQFQKNMAREWDSIAMPDTGLTSSGHTPGTTTDQIQGAISQIVRDQ